MFSYFKNGIIDTTPDKTIDLPELIKIIRNNPERILIGQIRLLRKEGNEEYQELKEKLPYLTPNCMVKYRSLKRDDDFNKNFIASSRYIYFDTDDIINVDEYKEYFIKKYGHLVSMVSKSSSCGGLSMLFKLTNNINSKEQFFDVWDNIRTTILQDETIDAKCKDIGRAMFISYDPEVFVNYDNEITVEVTDTINNEKRVNQPISYNNINNRLDYFFSDKKKEDYSYSVLPIDIVLTKLIRRTNVIVDNPVVDFKPIEYAEVFIPKVIVDGTKHIIYTSMIHQLVYLNPDIEKVYIFSFLFYVNNVFAKPKMNMKELLRLFNFVYDSIKSNGIIYPKTFTKYAHFNKGYKLTGKEKSNIANRLNGYYRRYENIKKIIDAKRQLNSAGTKITQKQVSRMTGLSLKTVQTHFNAEPIDMDQVIYNLNHPTTSCQKYITRPTGIRFKTAFSQNSTKVTNADFHPQNVPDEFVKGLM